VALGIELRASGLLGSYPKNLSHSTSPPVAFLNQQNLPSNCPFEEIFVTFNVNVNVL
jgi:hypothetical protein